MPRLELPHTAHCVVCGPANPHGIHLSSFVDLDTGDVHASFVPAAHHVGFDDLVHGGVLATVVDELMVWAAIWRSRRACVAGEFGVRFRQPARPGQPLDVVARVNRGRGKLFEAEATVTDAAGAVVLTGTGKYLAGPAAETAAFLDTLLRSPTTDEAVRWLRDERPTGT